MLIIEYRKQVLVFTVYFCSLFLYFKKYFIIKYWERGMMNI